MLFGTSRLQQTYWLCVMNAESTNSAEKLLVSVGLPPDFVLALAQESDWSLIIKLHAVFEAVIASLIVKQLKTPDVEEVVSHLDFNNVKSGKVAFARALGLIDSREVAFLRGLSELRNALVHDIKNVQFNLREHVRSLDDPQLKRFKSEFGASVCALENGERMYTDLLERKPAQIVLLAAYSCLLMLQFNVSAKARNALVEILMQRTGK